MTPNPRDILVAVPGRLCVNPANLAAAFPHGGTALGIVKAVSVRPGVSYQEVTAEEYGGERIEVVATGEAWVLAAILRSWDHDALSRFFPSEVVGGSGQPLVTHPSLVADTGRAGRLLSASSIVLCFSPDSPANHPGLVMHRAIPMLDAAIETNLSLARPQEIAVVFAAIRSAAGKSVSWGRLADIAL